jgi:hypothetical protein
VIAERQILDLLGMRRFCLLRGWRSTHQSHFISSFPLSPPVALIERSAGDGSCRPEWAGPASTRPCLDAAMPGNDDVVLVYQDGIVEAERADARCDLSDLL